MRIVKVIWEDASSLDSWEDMKDFVIEDYIVETIGYLFKKTDKHVVVVSHVCPSLNKAKHYMQIPMGMVRKIVKL